MKGVWKRPLCNTGTRSKARTLLNDSLTLRSTGGLSDQCSFRFGDVRRSRVFNLSQFVDS
jgi:hypothetical protein